MDKRVTIRLSDLDFRRLKIASAILEKSMQDCMDEALREWMQKHSARLGDVIRQAENISNPSITDTCEQGGEIPHRQTDTAA